ncbi:hypothetical protein CFTD6783_06225 [Campylobacter fetus subsp. testudinum]|uniref:hypothetical protein n=1 Tax=Campylobacter fetus TaxID=196 RepID=UPI0008189881|nr:hypothetical protein [Campylobacter fetus]OCS09718.1 hypothetical protein CFTD6783_06225 [Campylobacter fetus subsp. testudinum]
MAKLVKNIMKMRGSSALLHELINSSQWRIRCEIEQSDKAKNKLISAHMDELRKDPARMEAWISALEAFLDNKLVYWLTWGFWRNGKQDKVEWKVCSDIVEFFYSGVEYKITDEHRENYFRRREREDAAKIIKVLKAYLSGKQLVRRKDRPEFKEDLEWEKVGDNHYFLFGTHDYKLEDEEFIEDKYNLTLPNKPVVPVDLEFIKFRDPATYRYYKPRFIIITKFDQQPYAFTKEGCYNPTKYKHIVEGIWVAMLDYKKATDVLKEQVKSLRDKIFKYGADYHPDIGWEYIAELNDLLKSNQEFLEIYDENKLEEKVYES